ncbi:MAG TPA: (2Fe-2S)-binding protein [Acidimicrobiales bacterium]|nr:(2Fe-2S)-binding protein [Acidimicrobiales bacterium]
MAELVPVAFTLNGEAVGVLAAPNRSVADLLREDLRLTGTHLGCEHGVCGACTILVDGEGVRSCLLLAPQVEGCRVTTVEGLAPVGATLGPLQEAFRRHHALQCGFCTPGFLMTATALCADPAPVLAGGRPDREAVRAYLSGNLWRCTGYEGIVDAVMEHLRAAPPDPPAAEGPDR